MPVHLYSRLISLHQNLPSSQHRNRLVDQVTSLRPNPPSSLHHSLPLYQRVNQCLDHLPFHPRSQHLHHRNNLHQNHRGSHLHSRILTLLGSLHVVHHHIRQLNHFQSPLHFHQIGHRLFLPINPPQSLPVFPLPNLVLSLLSSHLRNHRVSLLNSRLLILPCSHLLNPPVFLRHNHQDDHHLYLLCNQHQIHLDSPHRSHLLVHLFNQLRNRAVFPLFNLAQILQSSQLVNLREFHPHSLLHDLVDNPQLSHLRIPQDSHLLDLVGFLLPSRHLVHLSSLLLVHRESHRVNLALVLVDCQLVNLHPNQPISLQVNLLDYQPVNQLMYQVANLQINRRELPQVNRRWSHQGNLLRYRRLCQHFNLLLILQQFPQPSPLLRQVSSHQVNLRPSPVNNRVVIRRNSRPVILLRNPPFNQQFNHQVIQRPNRHQSHLFSHQINQHFIPVFNRQLDRQHSPQHSHRLDQLYNHLCNHPRIRAHSHLRNLPASPLFSHLSDRHPNHHLVHQVYHPPNHLLNRLPCLVQSLLNHHRNHPVSHLVTRQHNLVLNPYLFRHRSHREYRQVIQQLRLALSQQHSHPINPHISQLCNPVLYLPLNPPNLHSALLRLNRLFYHQDSQHLNHREYQHLSLHLLRLSLHLNHPHSPQGSHQIALPLCLLHLQHIQARSRLHHNRLLFLRNLHLSHRVSRHLVLQNNRFLFLPLNQSVIPLHNHQSNLS